MNVLSREDTQEYLRVVSELETSKYKQERFCEELEKKHRLQEQKIKAEKERKIERPLYLYQENPISRFFRGFFIVERAPRLLAEKMEYDIGGCGTVLMTYPILGALLSGIVFLSIYIPDAFTIMFSDFLGTGTELNKALSGFLYFLILTHLIPGLVMLLSTRKVNDQYKEYYNYRINEANKQEEEKTRRIKVMEDQYLHLLNWEYAAKQSLLKTIVDLGKVYSCDIVYPKYRNFIAMCTMYEYFDSHRCDTLTGHEGAYNIYENELRLNTIVGMIEQLNSRMDVIENNQHVLAEAIRDTNYQLSSLSNQVEQVQLTAASAEYSAKVAAENSRYIACLETMRYIRENSN